MSLLKEFSVALCLVFILEGVIPFIFPKKWRMLVTQLERINDNQSRWIGFASMLIGVILLYLVH